jgi:hypothetical protein
LKSPKIISQNAYARHRGCSPGTVANAVKVGRIRLITDAEGRLGIDPVQADIDWQNNTDHTRNPNKPKAMHKGIPEKTTARKPPNPVLAGSFIDAKTSAQQSQAELLKIELLERQGKLVDIEQVQAESFRLGRQVRDNLMNIPARVVSRMRSAVDDHEAFTILEDEIRKACEGLK